MPRPSYVEQYEQRSLKNKLGVNEIMLLDHIEHLPTEVTAVTGRVLLASTESGLDESLSKNTDVSKKGLFGFIITSGQTNTFMEQRSGILNLPNSRLY